MHQTNLDTTNDIAIIGLSCRLPGNVNSANEFWSFLLAGGDGIVDIPSDRWDNAAYYDKDKEKPNKMYVNRGGFLNSIDQFDPQFFGISPKEAPHIDPQHRWLLELAYETFENAGVKVSELKGSNTAVYIGQFMHDYEQLQLDSTAHHMMSSHSATGPSMTLTANRISYAFDLTGPSVTLDTACSSSLVALDMACKALQSGDSKLAIAGGVNILLRPELTMSICKASMLSPDCKCQSFDAAANGYVRSEGAGIVLVKRLQDALDDGDNILAIIKATGVNQDGQTIGITVPNGESQKKLLLQSLGKANIAPEDIHYAEAHGTGTAVGDPIEVNALGSILGNRDDKHAQCVVGSVKSNIGHTEAAAGMAGLIKTVMALNESTIPKNIHYYQTNPAIDLKKLNIRIADQNLAWPDTQGKTRKAIVNSFGFGGTNANVVLEQPPQSKSTSLDQKPAINSEIKQLLLSAKTEKGLKDQAQNYLNYFQKNNNTHLHNICYTATIKREHYQHRLVINGNNEQEMIKALTDFLESKPSPHYLNAVSASNLGNRIAFVFSGMGPQWAGMGEKLYQTEPVYRSMMDKCDAALKAYTGWSLIEAILDTSDPAKIDATYIAQPAIFATQVSLAELLKSWGIVPSSILGHSAGEVAAAFVAGALDFDDAIKVIYNRSQLQHTTEGMGKMLAVGVSKEVLQTYLKGVESKVSIAAINSEQALTLAGDPETLTTIADQLDQQGLFARFLNVGVPYHSPVMDQLKAPLIASLQGITVHTPNVPLYSSVTAQLTKDGDWSPEYWADNVREPVLFKAAIDAISQTEVDAFLEIAPHSALSSSIEKNIASYKKRMVVAATLKRNQHDVDMLANTLASLHTSGIPVDWQKLYPGKGQLISLPNYAWQHARYWWESEDVQQARLKNIQQRGGFSESVHPLLGGRLNSPLPIWQKVIDLDEQSYLIDHQVEEDIVYPGAAYVEMALAVARGEKGYEKITLGNIAFNKALFLSKEIETVLESQFNLREGSYQINAYDAQKNEWSLFSSGVMDSINISHSAARIDLTGLLAKFSQRFDKTDFYQHCHKLGLTYRDCFQSVERAWFDSNESVVEILLPESLDKEDYEQYLLHPSILDGAFQSLFPTIGKAYLPVNIAELNYYEKPGMHLYCHLFTKYKDDFRINGDIRLFDADGKVLVEVLGVELKAIQAKSSDKEKDASLLYDFNWIEQELVLSSDQLHAQTTEGNHWIIFSDNFGVAQRLMDQLEKSSQKVILIKQEDVFEQYFAKDPSSTNLTASDTIAKVINQYADSCRGVIYLGGLNPQSNADMSGDEMMDACQFTSILPMFVAQALNKVSWKQKLNVFLVSESAWQINDTDPIPQPHQGALWGFGRVFASEHSEYNISLVDLSAPQEDATIKHLAEQVLSSAYEQEIALRPAKRYVNRLRQISDPQLIEYAQQAIKSPLERPYTLGRISSPGNTGKWALKELSITDTDENDILVKVEACALNRDELEYLECSEQQNRNFICSGKIIKLGKNVNQFSTGDEIITFSKSAVSSVVNINSAILLKKPEKLTSQQAAVSFKAFVSAHYAVNYLARLNQNETILIHDAADTLGLAAIQLAKINNASIYVTANTEEKIAYLKSIGLEHVFNSNEHNLESLAFSLQQKGIKVDVALNTLSGTNTNKTLELMNSFGRFIELGKYDGAALTYAQIERITASNISYHILDASKMAFERPELCHKLMLDIDQLFSSGQVSFLPAESFSITRVDSAVDYVYQKSAAETVVLTFNQTPVSIVRESGEQIKANRTYMVTGGLGGLGLDVMDWLVTSGADSIVLLGRGSPSPLAQQRISLAEKQGANIIALQADVTRPEDVIKVLQHIEKELPTLAGIVHSAGVLDDATIAQQTNEKFLKVLAPKVKGAWNLHQLTLDIDLDFFICFSSIASIVGWAGQSNYAAANGFMDTLAAHRRALGKASLTINWGPWSGSGMAANLDDKDIQRMKDSGMEALSPQQGLNAMTDLLASRVPQAGVFDLNWSLLTQQYPDPDQKTLLKDFFVDKPTNNIALDFIEQLNAAPAHLRASILEDKVSFMLADVLGLDSATSIDKDRSVFEYGMNSLMAMDLKNRLQRALKVRLTATLVLKHPTVNAMVEHIIECALDEVFSGKNILTEDVLLWDPNNKGEIINNEINGPLPFTLSVLHWFKQGKSTHFNIGFMVEFDDDKFDFEALKTSISILFTYHDGCRLQLFSENNALHQEIVPLADSVVINQHDFSDLSYAEGVARMSEENDKLHKSFAFTKGSPLFRMAHYRLNDAKPHRFFLIFHHYLSDGLSQKIIARDLELIYEKVFNKQSVSLQPKRDSLIDWNNRLHAFAYNEATEQVPYWASVIAKSQSSKIVHEKTDAKSAHTKTYSIASTEISAERYRNLVNLCSKQHIEMTDIAIYALIKAFSRLTSADSLWVDLVIHARAGIFNGIDVQNIFGQISESASILFELNSSEDLLNQLELIKQQRINVPTGGLGLKALRYINQDPNIVDVIGINDAPQVLVNFDLSDYGQDSTNNWVSIAKEGIGEADPPVVDNDYPREFYVTGTLKNGCLSIVFMFHNENFHSSTVNRIIDDMDQTLFDMENYKALALEH